MLLHSCMWPYETSFLKFCFKDNLNIKYWILIKNLLKLGWIYTKFLAKIEKNYKKLNILIVVVSKSKFIVDLKNVGCFYSIFQDS